MQQHLLMQLSETDLRKIISDTIKEQIQKIEFRSEKSNDVEFLTRKEAARFLGISLPTLSKLTREQLITPRRLGSVIRFEKNDLEKAFDKVNLLRGRRGNGKI